VAPRRDELDALRVELAEARHAAPGRHELDVLRAELGEARQAAPGRDELDALRARLAETPAAEELVTLRAQVVTTIRPDTVFVPYHWAGDKSVNLVTISSQDPVSKIPEYKVSAVRVEAL